MVDWRSMETAPKDGSRVRLRAVWGTQPDDGKVSFEGLAEWRTERRPGLGLDPLGRGIDGLEGPYESTGWMRADNPYRVPGRVVAWAPDDEGQNDKMRPLRRIPR